MRLYDSFIKQLYYKIIMLDVEIDEKLISKMEEDSKWLALNYDKIKNKFMNRFIAVKNKKIIANNDNLGELFANLRSKDINPSFTLIEFVPEKDLMLIL
jgi:ribosome biogenesis SPOUT family RNA methylase Rps3